MVIIILTICSILQHGDCSLKSLISDMSGVECWALLSHWYCPAVYRVSEIAGGKNYSNSFGKASCQLCVHSTHEFLLSFILVAEWLRVVDRFHSAIGQLEWIMNLPVVKHKLFITTPSLYFWYSFKEHLSVFSVGYEINCILRSGVRCNCINMIYLLNSCT